MADYLTQAVAQAFIGEKILIQLTDDDGDGNVNTTVLDQMIKVAEGEVNSRLYKGFQGPVTVADHGQSAFDSVQSLALVCLRYHLYQRRPNLMTEAYADAHVAALQDLTEMSKGAQALPGKDGQAVTRDSPETPSTDHSTVSTLTSSSRPTTRKWTRNSQGNA